MIKCICIDGFNTIEDGSVFEDIEPNSFNKIATVIGCTSEDIFEHLQFFCSQYGNAVWEYHEIFWRSLVKKYHCCFDEELIDRAYNCFLDFYEENVRLFDDVRENLLELSKYVDLILIANGNSKRLKRLIRKFNLNEIFTDYIISSETPYQKPHKFMFDYPIKKYNWNPQEVLMVGDKYDTDIIGAKNCGLLTAILISENKAPSNNKSIPDFMISSLSELKDLVRLSAYKNIQLIESIQMYDDLESEGISAFIVAGGRGSRLGELGEKSQKCMLELWGKPILYYTIVSLKNAGCSKIVIAVNHLKEQIIEYFKDGSFLGVSISYVEGNFTSTYDALYHSLPKLTSRIIYVHANILFQNKLLENIISLGNAKRRSVVAVVSSEGNQVKHAQICLDEEKHVVAVDLRERQGVFENTFLGVAYYQKEDFLRLFNGDKTGMVEKVLQQLISEKKGLEAIAYRYNGGWIHIETSEDYFKTRDQNRWDMYYG